MAAKLSKKLREKMIEAAAVLPDETLDLLPEYPSLTSANGWFAHHQLQGVGGGLGVVNDLAEEGYFEFCPCGCGNVFRIKSKYRHLRQKEGE